MATNHDLRFLPLTTLHMRARGPGGSQDRTLVGFLPEDCSGGNFGI